LDGVFVRISGELHYLWRAVDQHGVVLDIPVQDRRCAFARVFAPPLLRTSLTSLRRVDCSIAGLLPEAKA
jgi:transposase-like protein